MILSRRRFLVRAGALAASSLFFIRHKPVAEDLEIFRRVMKEAGAREWRRMPIGEVVEEVAASFQGAPYIAQSLEVPGEEHLVVNLRAYDCTTFVESMLALSRCVKRGNSSFQDFRQELQRIRYRNGVIDGYPSRLHYFVDWVADNAAKGIVKDVTEELGGMPSPRKIDYMTSHATEYRQLADKEVLQEIRAREDTINARSRFVLPAGDLPLADRRILAGDIIGVVTDEPGSDVSHIGLAIRRSRELQFLHAPLSAGKVEISQRPLVDYLRANTRRKGVIVARPLEP